jgi:8-oxo-dGTP pyrophosphatase MutT (NUDIX family)
MEISHMPDTSRNPWTRLERRVAYQSPWIIVYEDQVLRPDGKPGIYGLVHYQNLAVGVVALDERDRVLLVGQYRYTLERYSWEIPEGGAPADEEPLAAVQRELREETGYAAGKWQDILRAHLSNSVSDELAILYLARELTAGPAQPDGTEEIAVRWLPFADALALIDAGEITDAMTILAIQRVALMQR